MTELGRLRSVGFAAWEDDKRTFGAAQIPLIAKGGVLDRVRAQDVLARGG